jgi:hypothetical protein
MARLRMILSAIIAVLVLGRGVEVMAIASTSAAAKGELTLDLQLASGGSPTPVPFQTFDIIDTASGRTVGQLTTNDQGEAKANLLPGEYRVRSTVPVTFEGKRYSWEAPVIIRAGSSTRLELSETNVRPDATIAWDAMLLGIRPGPLNMGIFPPNLWCESERTKATDREVKATARYQAATKYRQCIDAFAAVVVASSDSYEQMFARKAVTETLQEQAADVEARAKAEANFMNLGWGVGFGFSYGFDDAIEEAAVVDGVIRVTKDQRTQPRVVFEFHQYFGCGSGTQNGNRGCGPFLAVAADQDDLLSGVGLGFIYGWRSKNPTSQQGFSVGIGVILDADVTSLADGFEEGQPLPPGTTEILYEQKSRWSGLLYVTRTF